MSTSPVSHILSVLIVHLCFASANLFKHSKTRKNFKHLNGPASAAGVIFCLQFPVACCILDTLALCGSFPLSSLLPLFYNLHSDFSRPCADVWVHPRCCEAPVHCFSCQWRRKQNWAEFGSSSRNGEYTAFKLTTIMLRPHQLFLVFAASLELRARVWP